MVDKVRIPPIKIQGIKTKLVNLISEGIRLNENGIWYEPFMGSGVVGLNLAPRRAVFADINPHVISLYNEIKTGEITSYKVREFLETEGKLLEEKDGEYYYYVRDRFNENPNSLDFLFLNRSCFNGMIRFNRDYKFNVPYGHKPARFSKAYVTKIVNQVKWLETLFPEKEWEFKCQSYIQTIREASKEDFIYCDPPYIGRHVDYYDSWDEEHEVQLRNELFASGAKFMLSTWEENKYRRNEYIDTIWNGCYKLNQKHFYYIGAKESNRNAMTEALLMNYDPDCTEGRVNSQYEQLSFWPADSILREGGQEMKFDFIRTFNRKIKEDNINWEVSSLISTDKKLYSLGSDSKLIGRIFELISYELLQEIADENGFMLQASEKQTVYPDFTLMKNKKDTKKIAIDVKTTYRKFNKKGKASKIRFTLGSYGSFMRDGKKNIMYPYSEYDKHYVICFIYTRNESASEGKIYTLDELDKIPVPYKDVEVFVQEKYKISGDKPGSGDTENIGSYRTNQIDYLIKGKGPFSTLGVETFDEYWSGYPRYRAAQKEYTSLEEYFEWCAENGRDISESKRLYTYWKKEHEN